MELLIIGASSYIGNELYKEAKRRNVKVIGTRNQTKADEFLKYDMTKDDIGNIAKELTDNKKYALICSAIPSIDECFTNHKYAYHLNVTCTIRLLNELNKLGFQSIFLSTDSVFSGREGYYSEQDKPIAINHYGRMKIEVEEYIQKNLNNACIMRISKIFGDTPHPRNLFTEWYKLASNGSPIHCIKNNIYSPTDINDIVNCFFFIINHDLKGLYNICNGEHFERNELAYQFLRQLNLKAEIRTMLIDKFNFKDKRPLKTYMSNDKFVKETNYQFRSVKDMIEQYKNNIIKNIHS